MLLQRRIIESDAQERVGMSGQLEKTTRMPKAPFAVVSILITDLIALFLSIGLTIIIRLELAGGYSPAEYVRLWPMIGIFIVAFALTGLYPGVPVNPVSEFRGIFLAVTVVFLIFGVFIFLSHSAEIWSRGVFLVACPISAIFVVLARSGLRHSLAKRPWWGVPVVILGAGQTGQAVAETLVRSPWIGLKVVAVLDASEETIRDRGNQQSFIVGGLDLVSSLIQKDRVNYAIVAMPHASRPELTHILEQHANKFRHILIIPGFLGLSSLWVTAQDIGGMLGLEVRQSLLQLWPQLSKRMLDLVITISVGLLLSPLFLLVYSAIKMTSSGSAVYGQERIGRDNKHFTAWKFRTMVSDADEALNHHLERQPDLKAEWQRDHKLRNDPRVTPIGRFLRRTSLDELPQLWNVLIGEMSLVGPRPIVDSEVLKYGSRFQLYCRVRPGITGLWQVSGRNDTGYDQRVQFDEYYVRNWSVWLDLYILGRTLGTILRCTGAY